jgi:hypothetical protein
LPEPDHHGIKKKTEKELEEQAYRLRVFLEIVAEADMLLLKKLLKERKERQGDEEKG